MRIVCDLDSAHSERLRQLQETWSQSLDQVIARLIDIALAQEPEDSAEATMLASEAVLRREWDSPEEDAAWAHL